MTVSIAADIHFDAADVGHRFKGGPGAFAVLDIGTGITSCSLHFRYGGPELIDAVIAELVALRNEMAPPAPVITCSERTCPEANPESGAWCHKNGKHKTHRDANGYTWTTTPGRVGVPERMPTPASHYCDSGNCGVCGDGTGDGDGQYRTAAGDEEEPRCKCGHPQVLHDEDSQEHECHAIGCDCDTWTTAAPEPAFVTEISGVRVGDAFKMVAS